MWFTLAFFCRRLLYTVCYHWQKLFHKLLFWIIDKIVHKFSSPFPKCHFSSLNIYFQIFNCIKSSKHCLLLQLPAIHCKIRFYNIRTTSRAIFLLSGAIVVVLPENVFKNAKWTSHYSKHVDPKSAKKFAFFNHIFSHCRQSIANLKDKFVWFF